MTPAGRFRARCVFQARGEDGDDGHGNVLEAWGDIEGGAVRGRYLPSSVREAVAAGRLEDSESGVLTVRSSSVTRTLTSAHRVLIDGEVFGIVGGPTDYDQRRACLDFKVIKGEAT